MTTTSAEFLALQRAVAGRYSLDREIGRGGMGIVFLARDVALERPVAIKLLPPLLATQPEHRERFLREARMAAQLSHPNIVPIHAVEEHGDLVFFVMTYVDGETLGERVRRQGPLPSHEALRVIQEVAWALSHAHARQLVHRDVKPDNVLLERESGRALVTDFGIARTAQESGDGRSSEAAGTPQYMSPEQAAGGGVDARTDLYALGATACFTVTGRPPFSAGTVAGLIAKHATEAPPALLSVAPRVPAEFARIIDRCLAKDPRDRPGSAEEVASVLSRARGALVEAPPPLRAFLREHEGAGTEMGMALVGSGAALGLSVLYSGDLFAGFVFLPVSAVLAGLAAARFGQVVLGMRDLVREGYGFAALRAAVELDRRRQEDEAPRALTSRQVRNSLFYGTVGAVKTAAAVWLAGMDGPIAINVLGAAGAVAIPALTLRKIWTDLRRGRNGLWQRFLKSRVAGWLLRAAGTAVRGRRPGLPAPGEPTALALGREADRLFDALPAPARERLRNVPELIDRLEADALRLRGAVPDDPAADGRLATAVAALETLRLDLLRLHAGQVTPDELTADLDRARLVAEDIDAMLAGRREVAALTKPETHGSG